MLNKKGKSYYFCWGFFLAFVIFKTHDDFGYYHFPYSYYLNKFSMIIGIGPLNLGFRTPSSIFYLNSLFYFPYIEYYLYHISVILIMGFSNIILILNIKNYLEKEFVSSKNYKSELKWFDGAWSRFKPYLGKDKRGVSVVDKKKLVENQEAEKVV